MRRSTKLLVNATAPAAATYKVALGAPGWANKAVIKVLATTDGTGGLTLKAIEDNPDDSGTEIGVLLRKHVDLAIISGRPGKATQARVEELGFKHVVFGQADKLAGYARLAHLGLADDEVAYMGDDVNDLPLLQKVGLSGCPSDAHPEVRSRVQFVAGNPGGAGAVRELCELIL